jgi:hypothetical protein
MIKEAFTPQARFIRNPDVVLHEEDPDGALVYCPDTDQIRVLNQTGFFVWQLCDGNHDLNTIVSNVLESFDAVPEDKVFQQVQGFIDEMAAAGFIGTVEKETGEP